CELGAPSPQIRSHHLDPEFGTLRDSPSLACCHLPPVTWGLS
ncbi:mCG141552, partial [Mus musculus]